MVFFFVFNYINLIYSLLTHFTAGILFLSEFFFNLSESYLNTNCCVGFN